MKIPINLPKVSLKPRLIVIAVVVCLVAVGGFAMLTRQNDEIAQNMWWIGDDECVDHIKQAKDDAATKYGQGNIKIPSDVRTGSFTITGYDTEGWAYFDSPPTHVTHHRGVADPDVYVWELWKQKGAQYKEGIAVIDGCYLCACTEREGNTGYGHVGDVITFYASDGSAIDCIMADSKSSGDSNYSPWGHTQEDGTVNVIEFEVEPEYYIKYGNPGSAQWHPELKSDIRSATNHGMHPDLVGKMGMVGSAVANMSDIGSKAANKALSECKSDNKAKGDNSTLASALASYSMSKSTRQSDDEASSPLYEEVCDAIWHRDPNLNCTVEYHYHSCDTGVSAAVHWTGADLDFPAVGPAAQYAHCEESPLWKAVTEDGQPTDLTDDKAKSMGLEPGDIGITLGDHILAYVGEDAVNEAYTQVIKKVGGVADQGEPDAGSCMVSASAHQRGANIHPGYSDPRGYKYFRYTGDYPDKDKYKDVGSKAMLNSSSSRGTSCECEECEKAKNNVGSAEKFAEIAHKEATEGSSIAPKSYREATLEVARRTSKDPNDYPPEFSVEPGFTIPDDPFHGWGGGCSAFVYWCCLEAGMEPGEHLPTGAKLVTFSAEDALIRSHPDIGTIHVMHDGSEAGYIPQVGDVAYLDGGCHFEIVTEVNKAAGTYKTATDGAETERQLDLSGSALGHSSYDVFVTFNWGNMQTKSSSTKKSDKEECDCDEDWKDVKSGDASAFDGDEEAQMNENAKKIWQAFSEIGLSDDMIAGILSNLQTECAMDPTGIEALYDDMYGMGGRKASMAGNDEKSKDAMSEWCQNGMRAAYGSMNLHWPTYGPEEGTGRYYPGVGLGSWTGPSEGQVPDLMDNAEKLGKRWWDLDYQIAFLIAARGYSPSGVAFWEQMKSDCSGMDPTGCAGWVYQHYEMPNASSADPAHTQHATAWREKINGWTKDPSYAKGVMDMANKLGSSASQIGAQSVADKCDKMKDDSVDARVQAVIAAAESLVGKDYVWGYQIPVDAKPDEIPGTDCNGLTWWCYQQAGWNIPYPSGHYCEGQFQWFKDSGNFQWKTDESELKPGDVVFYSYDGGATIYHVALYVGNHEVIHANGSSWGIVRQDLNFDSGFCGGATPFDGPQYNG